MQRQPERNAQIAERYLLGHTSAAALAQEYGVTVFRIYSIARAEKQRLADEAEESFYSPEELVRLRRDVALEAIEEAFGVRGSDGAEEMTVEELLGLLVERLR